jgi:hypothetical protein
MKFFNISVLFAVYHRLRFSETVVPNLMWTAMDFYYSLFRFANSYPMQWEKDTDEFKLSEKKKKRINCLIFNSHYILLLFNLFQLTSYFTLTACYTTIKKKADMQVSQFMVILIVFTAIVLACTITHNEKTISRVFVHYWREAKKVCDSIEGKKNQSVSIP